MLKALTPKVTNRTIAPMTRLKPQRLQNNMVSSSPSHTKPPRLPARASSPSPSSAHIKKPINLLRGWPAPSLLPVAALQLASTRALTTPSISTPALLYGPDAGYQPLRDSLATWLSRFYGTKEHGDRVAVTGGASQSVACILQSFTDPAYTRGVWMVAPCYYLACPIFADAGLGERLRAVPEGEEGIDLQWLERGLREMEEAKRSAEAGVEAPGVDAEVRGKKKQGNGAPLYKDPKPYRKIYRHVIYCVPSFSNPSGKTMTLRCREALVHLARKYDALVICDDVYDMLQWPTILPSTSASSASTSTSPSTILDLPSPKSLTSALLPRLVDIDNPLGPSPHDPPGQHFGHAVSNGTFSKLVGPGTRTGWVNATADFALGVSQTGSTRSGGAPSQLCAAIVSEMLVSGALDAHIEDTLKPAYQRRHRSMMDAIHRVLVPLGAAVDDFSLAGEAGVFGGYFVWIRLPADGPLAKVIAARCQDEEGLVVGYGDMFEVQGDEGAVKFERDIRLCFAWEDEADLVDGVERLGEVVGRLRDERAAGVDCTRSENLERSMHKFK